MRILFTFIGGIGHFEPLAPVARAVRAAGHEVAVACSGTQVDRVAAAGFTALPTSDTKPRQPGPRDLTPLEPTDARAAEVEFAQNFADKGARRHAREVQRWIRDWRPDVVVRDEADLGSAIAAEVLDVPCVNVLVLAAGTLIRPDLVGPPLQAVRAEHGLAPNPGLTLLSRGPVLSPFPPSFRAPDSPVPLTARHFRSAVPLTAARGTRRSVYVTLGTVFNTGSGDLFERLLAGLAEVDADVLVTVGRDIDPADLGPQPHHVRVEQFVPQDEVLATTDLVVSHGGSGSLLATLAHGLPSVLLPLGADQPHNAARARELGLAHVLDAASATPYDVRDAVLDALADEAVRANARQVAAEIAGLPGVGGAVALLKAAAG